LGEAFPAQSLFEEPRVVDPGALSPDRVEVTVVTLRLAERKVDVERAHASEV